MLPIIYCAEISTKEIVYVTKTTKPQPAARGELEFNQLALAIPPIEKTVVDYCFIQPMQVCIWDHCTGKCGELGIGNRKRKCPQKIIMVECNGSISLPTASPAQIVYPDGTKQSWFSTYAD